ncbi:MAG: M23 family metallopeptidase [Leptospiraceae bacterium]|nr:M23 family metallopeptidase [Leptospiraceae bacterium]
MATTAGKIVRSTQFESMQSVRHEKPSPSPGGQKLRPGQRDRWHITICSAQGLIWETELRPLRWIFAAVGAVCVLMLAALAINLDDTNDDQSFGLATETTRLPDGSPAERYYNLLGPWSGMQEAVLGLRFGQRALLQYRQDRDTMIQDTLWTANQAIGGEGDATEQYLNSTDWLQLHYRRLGLQYMLADLDEFARLYDFWLQGWPHVYPVDHTRQYVTSPYGYRRIGWGANQGQLQFHKGIDLRGAEGTIVRAAASGFVHIASASQYGYGRQVRIVHDSGYETLYAHMSRLAIDQNRRVRAGEIIGTVGQSGLATGPHLHFEVRLNGKLLDPAPFILE